MGTSVRRQSLNPPLTLLLGGLVVRGSDSLQGLPFIGCFLKHTQVSPILEK